MIAVIDYGIGNLASVINALKRLKIQAKITADPEEIKKADALILPGVGAAGEGMRNLKKRGLDKIIIDQISKGRPFLGICLGMQLLFEKSEEGDVECLGVIRGKVIKFKKERKVPQIGWNNIKFKVHPAQCGIKFKNIPDNSYFYFVNSYYCEPGDKSIIAAETIYGEKFPSVVMQKNIVATQFHPEKSGKVGFLLLENILRSFTC